MSFQPDWTLLVQDLLSPAGTTLPPSALSLISYHLASIPTNNKQHTQTLVHSIITSPSLWNGLASPSSTQPIPVPLAEGVLSAVRNGLLYRLALIDERNSIAWWAQSELSKWIESVLTGLEADGRAEVALVVLSGLLAGLQQARMRRQHSRLVTKSIVGRLERALIERWSAYFADQSDASFAATADDGLPIWLLCQTMPPISVEALSAGPSQPMIDELTTAISSAFQQGTLFSDLDSDLSSDGPERLSLRWTIPSRSHSLLSSLTTATNFTLLGSVSRSLGRAYEAAAIASTASPSSSTLDSFYASLQSLSALCEQVQLGWRASRWSDLTTDDQLVAEPSAASALPWTALKSLLFSITLVLSSVLVLASPKPGEKPTPKQVELARVGLEMLSKTYFIASKFVPDGFGAWKGVWVGLVSVVKVSEDGQAAEEVLERLAPAVVGELHEKVVDRAVATFYLNTAEQLVPSLSAAFIESRVLQVCKPYLATSEFRNPFESAHSVVLAIFATQEAHAIELAPWYTTLLLDLAATKDKMSPTQLRLAFTTMVRSVSASDDALALWSIHKLVDAIKQLPPSPPSAMPSSSSTSTEEVTEMSRSFSSEPTRLDEASPSTKSEDTIVALPRGALLLTLIDQAAAVNLFLLEKVLEQVWELVREEGDAEAREALARCVFVVLSEGLSKEKRALGTEWWLERGEELVQ